MFSPAMGTTLGLLPENGQCWAIARAAFLRGDICQFDIALSNANVTNNDVASMSSGLVNMVAPSAGGLKTGFMGVWLQSVAAGNRGKVLVIGDVEAYVIKASGDIAAGDPLVGTTAKNLSPDTTVGYRFTAFARESVPAPTTRTLARVYFNGLKGMGQVVS